MLRRLRGLVFRNPGPKLACFLVAFGLWFWVTIQQSGEAEFEVPITYVNVPSNIIVADRSNRVVHVTLQGTKTSLLSTDASDVSVQLDLSGQTPGEKAFWSRELGLDVPRGLRLVNIRPRTMRVVLKRRVEKTLPVGPSVGSAPPDGYDYRLTVSPDTASVYGAEEALQGMEELTVEPVELANRTSNFTRDDLPAQLPSNVQLSYPARNQFQVSVEIFQLEVTRTFEEVPVLVENVPPGRQAVVEPSSIELAVRGPKRSVQRLSPEDIIVAVQAPDTGNEVQIRLPEIELPGGVRLVDDAPETQTFKVRIQNP